LQTYTFRQNYYFMMGDNRHNSEDSRMWGFVPEDHIVGKPLFVWWSVDQQESWANPLSKIRWNKIGSLIR
jgi:signal peptidase I